MDYRLKKTTNKQKTFDKISDLTKISDAYFKKCDSRKKQVVNKDGGIDWITKPAPYVLHEICHELGITTATFRNWCKGSDDFAQAAKLIHLKITGNRIRGALDGEQNSAFAQFLLKNDNKNEYSDKVISETTVSDSLLDFMASVAKNANKIEENAR